MLRLLSVLCAVAGAALAAPWAYAREPNDPLWYAQWAQKLTRVHQVWDVTTGSPSIVIASVDTGVNTAIPDFAGAFVPGWDFMDGDAEIEDQHGHGTLAASVMVARGDNGIGAAGICWQCKLMPVRVTRDAAATDETVAAGIRWAADHDARVISVGFVQTEGAAPEQTVGAAIRYAQSRGALVVSAAGNHGSEAPTFPGSFPGVLSVTATDDSDRLYSWSARGSWVAVAAPGCNAVTNHDNLAGELCGSSVSGPQVAGIAALALSLNPLLTPQAIIDALVATAKPIPGLVRGGRVDAYAALARLGVVPPTPPVVKQKPAPPTVVTRTFRGVVKQRRRVTVSVGTGSLTIRYSSPQARDCLVSVMGGGEMLLARPRSRSLLSVGAHVPAGRYVVEVACRTARAKRYVLTVRGAAAPRTSAR